MLPAPLDFQKWIEDNRHLLKPPVGNKCVYAGDFIVMVVGGPNARKDYHVDPGAELFYQLEGEMLLKTQQDGHCVDVTIRAGQMFLLPEFVPHSPQRLAGGVGLVVERKRTKGEQDGLQWYCESCNHLLYEEYFELTDIETQFPPVFARFFADQSKRTCKACGSVLAPPAAAR
jgi:3-hydroxyanthranilate 3,4-dioxygenase